MKKPTRIKPAEAEIQKDLLPSYQEKETSYPSVLNREDASVNKSGTQSLFKKSKWLYVIGVTVATLSGIQLFDALISIFEKSQILGVIFSSIVAAVAIACVWQVKNFLFNRRLLHKQDKNKSSLKKYNHHKSHGNALSVITQLHRERNLDVGSSYSDFISKSHICQDDAEVIELYQSQVIALLDNKAKKIATKHATDSAMMIALSPFVALDMMLVVWRNTKLINDIAQVYGIEQFPFSRFTIFKKIMKHMMLVGAQELVMDATFESLGVSLGSKLSARAAQGIGAGLITLKIGLHAIQYCRPLEFNDDNQLKMSHLRTEIVKQVKERLLSLKHND